MDSSVSHLIILLILFALFIDAAKSENVVFIHSPDHGFLHSPSDTQSDPMSVPDVAAAVSMLLGFAPSHKVSAQSASKLNEILAPNPFNRPRAVFLLEVTGVSEQVIHFQSRFSASLNRIISVEGNAASIQLSGRDEALVTPLDEPVSNDDWTDKHISDFALWIGGSYASDAVKPLNGELVFPLTDGAKLKLHMSQAEDREFTYNLLKLVNNVKKAIKLHAEAAKDGQRPAELLMGSFNYLKGLNEKRSAEDGAQQRTELFVSTTAKLFDLLLDAYKGRIVGVVVFEEKPSANSVSLFEVTSTSPSARSLEENDITVSPTFIARVLLVRLTIAWMTGLLLLVATIIGVYFLMNMPLTRDTLLYSNVKLD